MATLNNHVRRRGSYAPLSAHYYLDDALAQAGEEAELLYVRSLAFCAATLSDGFISTAQLARGPGVALKNLKRRTERLVSVGLWEEVAGGFLIRSWLSWNKPRNEILAAAEAERERKSRGGRSGHGPVPPGTSAPVPPESGRNPDGIRTESGRNPDGIPPESGTTRARISISISNSNSNSNSSSGDVESEPVTWVAAANEKPPPPDGARRRRATRIPDDFSVDAAMVTWARKNTPHVDGRRELEQFRDFWQAKSGKDATKLDWVATWRTWMRREEQRQVAARHRHSGHDTSRTDEWQAMKLNGTDGRPLRALPGGGTC